MDVHNVQFYAAQCFLGILPHPCLIPKPNVNLQKAEQERNLPFPAVWFLTRACLVFLELKWEWGGWHRAGRHLS